MATAVKRRGGTTVQHSTFIGQARELTINTDTKIPHVHDGVRAGGFPVDYDVNVQRFGAKGDGTTDDTVAIQAAIDAAGIGDGEITLRGNRVFFPPGVYKFSNLVLKRGCELIGSGLDFTLLRQTSTTGYGILFDSTGLTPTGVQDTVRIRDLRIWQVGAATAGAAIYVNGQTSDARAIIENVHIQNAYRGVILRNTIQSHLKNVNVFYAVETGFKFTGSTYLATFMNCFAANGGLDGWEISDGNYVQFIGCGADNNAAGAGFKLLNTHFCGMFNCGNEGNKYGAYLTTCDGVVIDTFYTLVKSYTLNAVVLDGSQRCELRALSSAHVNAAYGTHFVSAINGSVMNKLSLTYQTDKWPGASNSGVTDNLGAFNEASWQTQGAQAAATNVRYATINHTNGITNLRRATFNGGDSPLPSIDWTTTMANMKRIIALYSSGNTFSGIGMDPTSVGLRLAGNPSGGMAVDMGYYSEDGAFTWTSVLAVDQQGNVTVKRTINLGASVPPASSSATGTGGMIRWDTDYIYVATGTNTWKRAALSTF